VAFLASGMAEHQCCLGRAVAFSSETGQTSAALSAIPSRLIQSSNTMQRLRLRLRSGREWLRSCCFLIVPPQNGMKFHANGSSTSFLIKVPT
jgi:hypothetical protein